MANQLKLEKIGDWLGMEMNSLAPTSLLADWVLEWKPELASEHFSHLRYITLLVEPWYLSVAILRGPMKQQEDIWTNFGTGLNSDRVAEKITTSSKNIFHVISYFISGHQNFLDFKIVCGGKLKVNC